MQRLGMGGNGVRGRRARHTPLTISSPSSFQIIQRDADDKADILVRGTYRGFPTAIEARFNGGSWATIDAFPSGGSFVGILEAQTAGQGDLEVRFANDTAKTATLAKCKIGDLWYVGGQSNNSGRFDEDDPFTPQDGVEAGLFGNDYRWQALADFTDSSVGQVDTVTSDAGLEKYSLYPALARTITARTGLPVGFIAGAHGGTSITNWLPGSNHLNRSTHYGSSLYRLRIAGGRQKYPARGYLKYMGESNAQAQTSAADAGSGFGSFANALFADCGVPTVLFKLPNLPIYDSLPGAVQEIRDGVDLAIAANPTTCLGPVDLSELTADGPDGLHNVGNAIRTAIVERVDAALAALTWAVPARTAFRPNTPLVTGAVRGWWKADTGLYQDSAGSTAVTATTQPLGRWEDQSGSGNHLTQATSGNRPTFIRDAYSGRPMILFDGLASYLTGHALASYLAGTGKTWTIYAVLLAVSQAGPKCVFGGGRSINATTFLECLRSSGAIGGDRRNDANTLVTATNSASALSFTKACVAYWQCDGATLTVGIDSTTPVTSSFGSGTYTLDRFTVGCRLRAASTLDAFTNSYLGEIAIVDAVTDSGDHTSMLQYLAERWNT